MDLTSVLLGYVRDTGLCRFRHKPVSRTYPGFIHPIVVTDDLTVPVRPIPPVRQDRMRASIQNYRTAVNTQRFACHITGAAWIRT